MSLSIDAEPVRAAIPIQRWYDLDIHLSGMVRTLETLSSDSQTLFAHLLKDSTARIIKIRGRSFVRALDWTIFIGLVKSKRSRRWYDQKQVLHVAFNMLYSLSDADKALIGRELFLPAELVLRYETYAKARHEEISIDVVHRILETCIKQGPEKALETYSIFH